MDARHRPLPGHCKVSPTTRLTSPRKPSQAPPHSPMKILFVCESFSPRLSGGKVARYLFKILSEGGHEVRVAVTSPSDEEGLKVAGYPDAVTQISSRRRYYWRLYSLLNTADVPAAFKSLVEAFAPDVIHFASFDQTKSPNLYRYARSKRIRVVLQPWTMHFYCAQGFGFKDNSTCTRCLDNGFKSAIVQGCTNVRGAVGQLERVALKYQALEADAVLSSNSDLDGILHTYGVPSEKIHRFPVPFDINGSQAGPVTRGDYYIYYGQAVSHKGIDFLMETFSEMPQRKLRIYPMASFVPVVSCPPNIEIIPGIGWHNGLREAIANSRAALVPSLWMTSTEYSLCEALVMKKPTIVFAVGVHKNILAHRVTAMVSAPHDKLQFKASLSELEGDPALYSRIAQAGAEKIRAINDPAVLLAQLMQAYAGV